MDAFILEKTFFESFINDIARDSSVYLPSLKKDIFDFRPSVEKAFTLEQGLTRQSLKRFLLPNGDIVFTFNQKSGDSEESMFTSGNYDKKIVVLGVRPCDARSVILNANALLSDSSGCNSDSCFQQLWDNLTVVGLACTTPCAEGFCRSVGGDPASEEGMDLLLTDIGDSFHVKALTEKGTLLTTQVNMQPAGEAASKKLLELVETTRKEFPPDTDPDVRLADGDINTLFDLPLWEELAERCLNCGICTNLCPTCFCFDMLDYGDQQQGYRFRVWDSCMYQLFTQHASGHNPRKSKIARIRQRFMHKLRYYPEKFSGQVACVGCGRCIRYCPVNIDIREVARQINLNKGGENG